MGTLTKMLSAEQKLAEVEDLLRSIPTLDKIRAQDAENYAWFGRAKAVVNSWSGFKALQMDSQIDLLQSGRILVGNPYGQVMATLHEMRHDLRMTTVGPLSSALGQGQAFDYFDEVRKVIQSARVDVFFIDPFLEAEFVSRYLPYVADGVTVRLLGGAKMTQLIPAVQAYRLQSPLQIEMRSHPKFHDRYVFIDKMACYQSGASFKDGAKKAPTTLTQIGDAFTAMQSTYEGLWAAGTVH